MENVNRDSKNHEIESIEHYGKYSTSRKLSIGLSSGLLMRLMNQGIGPALSLLAGEANLMVNSMPASVESLFLRASSWVHPTSSYHPSLPGSPLKGPKISAVIQPP
jgi:hypothetical protein